MQGVNKVGVISKQVLVWYILLKSQMGGVWYVRQYRCTKVLTIKWKCLKIHLLIFCVMEFVTNTPHPSGTPCRLKQTKEIICTAFWWIFFFSFFFFCSAARIPGAVPVNLTFLSLSAVERFLMQVVSRATAAQRCWFLFKLSPWICLFKDGKEEWNVLKCLWRGKGLLCCSHEPLAGCFEGAAESGKRCSDRQIRTTRCSGCVLWLGQWAHTRTQYTKHTCFLRYTTHSMTYMNWAAFTVTRSLLSWLQTTKGEFTLLSIRRDVLFYFRKNLILMHCVNRVGWLLEV